MNSDNLSDTDEYLSEDEYNSMDHFIVNEKGNSSPEPNRISLDDFNLEINSIITDNFYDTDELKTVNLYNVLNNADILIFVDNYKLLKGHRSCLKKIRRINMENEYPGCTFLPTEYISNIKEYIHNLNIIISNNELMNQKIYNDTDIVNSIYFEENLIKKNLVYKKMEIMDKILFIPLNKYQLKQTEYKIRGFCQIVEELGAKKIDIKFLKSNSLSKKVNLNLSAEINLFAGNLGLISNNSNNNKEDQSYTLEYPSITTISLNEKNIIKKIRKKKFIISEIMYNSNLELQYLVHSRCRHFITNYSTVFSIDDDNIIDKRIETKLKHRGIGFGGNYSIGYNNNSSLKIITNVEFSTKNDYYNNLSGHSVSLDKVGFKCLIDSFNNDDELLKKKGIYKIITFINLYVEKILKHDKYSRYSFIIKILKKIKKYLSLDEYSIILLNHFNCSSQWIHFNNFIDLLSNKTQCYDKLGYLIIVCDDEDIDIKMDNMIRFIQELCVKKNIENKFWNMLKPNRKELSIYLNDKLKNKYSFIDKFNWYSLNCLIEDINRYCVDFSNLDKDEYFKKLIMNIKLGYSHLEFYENTIPFIIRFSENINYNKKQQKFFSNIFTESLNYESFIASQISNLNELEIYIKYKIERIENIFDIINDFEDYISKFNLSPPIQNNLIKYISSYQFINKYKYFNKKINIVIPKNKDQYLFSMIKTTPIRRHSIEYISSKSNKNQINNIINSNLSKTYTSSLLVNHKSLKRMSESNSELKYKLNDNDTYDIINFFKKILIYNEKINIKKLSICSYNFDIIYKNFHNGIKEIEYVRYIKIFIIKLIKLILNDYCFNNYYNKTEEIKVIINDIINIINCEYFTNNCTTFSDLIHCVTRELTKNNISFNKDIFTNLCLYF
jgi:hypothetical protein